MITASPVTRQTVGKTFSIAISVLGAGALMQLGIIAWAFATRSGTPASMLALNGPDPTSVARLSTPAPGPSGLDLSASPLPAEPPQTLTTTPAPAGPAKPTPVQQKAPYVEPNNRFEEMLVQGRQLRDRGDTSTAITKFRETSAIDPKNPIPIAELAATYDKMGYADKAAENWRRIYEMGDTAGVYFSLAEAKLKASQAIALKDVGKQAPEVSTDAPAEGIAAGAILGLMPVKIEEERDDSSARKFNLHVPIKARPKTRVEVKDLVIHVLFYDIVDGQNVVQTSANVNSRWVTPPADWSDSDTEELAVEYQLPKPEAKLAKRENRKFFGYIVRIYYKQQLQAATAEPERLAQQYPPPPTLPKETDK
jgi:hypothetical protein